MKHRQERELNECTKPDFRQHLKHFIVRTVVPNAQYKIYELAPFRVRVGVLGWGLGQGQG